MDSDGQRGRRGDRTVADIDRNHQIEAVFNVCNRVIYVRQQGDGVVTAGIDGHRDHWRCASRAGQRAGSGTAPSDRNPVGGQRGSRRVKRIGERFTIDIGRSDRAGCRCAVGGIGRAGRVRIGQGQPFLGHSGRSRRNHWRIIGAVDGDGQRCSGGVPVCILDRVGERFGQHFVSVERLYRRISIVDQIGVGAIGVERYRAVGTCQRRANSAARNRGNRTASCRTIGADRICSARIAVTARAGQDVASRGQRTVFGHRVGIVSGDRRIVVDADRQSARCAVAVCIGNGVVQRKGLVVLVTASGVHDRRKLRDGVSTGRRIKRDYHDLDGALEHVDPGAVGSIREASRSARVRQCPGQRAVAARTRQRTGGVGGIGSDVVGAAGVAASQRVVVEQNREIGPGERSCIGDADR